MTQSTRKNLVLARKLSKTTGPTNSARQYCICLLFAYVYAALCPERINWPRNPKSIPFWPPFLPRRKVQKTNRVCSWHGMAWRGMAQHGTAPQTQSTKTNSCLLEICPKRPTRQIPHDNTAYAYKVTKCMHAHCLQKSWPCLLPLILQCPHHCTRAVKHLRKTTYPLRHLRIINEHCSSAF